MPRQPQTQPEPTINPRHEYYTVTEAGLAALAADPATDISREPTQKHQPRSPRCTSRRRA